jgi:hypothetical protein
LFFNAKGTIVIHLLVYVDDIIVVSSSPRAVDALLADLKSDFAIKNLGDLHYFLDVEVKSTDQGLLLSQGKYVSDILGRVGMMKCKEVTTPLSTSTKLTTHGGTDLTLNDATNYRSDVGESDLEGRG